MTDLTVQQSSTTEHKSLQSALIEIVQRPDIDPERLEKFLDLQIKMEERQALKDFNEAMAKFQSECPIIKKTKRVDFVSSSGKRTQYDYAPLDEMVFVIKPILDKYGLSYSFNMFEMDGLQYANLVTTIKHINGHSQSSNYHFDPIHDDNRMNLSQRRKAAITFAKREGLQSALGIVTQGEDDDARRAIDQVATEEQMEKIESLLKSTKTEKKKLYEFLHLEVGVLLSRKDADTAINALQQKRGHNVQASKL